MLVVVLTCRLTRAIYFGRFAVDTMKTTIQRWGNSLAVRIPKTLALETAMDEGDEVDLRADEERIVVEHPQVRSYRLNDLLAGVTKANCHTETDCGLPVGRENW